MAIYQVDQHALVPLPSTTFSKAGVLERQDLQRLLRANIGIVSPDTLVIAEEFGDWEDSRRRIDLLGVDKDANLIVIELKRTDDGGHMELQALRYAAMVSVLSFDKAVEIFAQYLDAQSIDMDARETLLDFLGWDGQNLQAFAGTVRIVLASADFSREITTSVLWLNQQGLDIRCVRLQPYLYQEKVLLDVQQVIPLPQAQEYQVQIRDKVIAERTARSQYRDFTKYDVTVGAQTFERQPKRRALFHIIKFLCDQGVEPEAIAKLIDWRGRVFRVAPGILQSSALKAIVTKQQQEEGYSPNAARFFVEDEELIHFKGNTYALSKMWGSRTEEAMALLKKTYPSFPISFAVHED